MLFLLTGDVQVGKTRWLEGIVSELAAAGVESHGVVAPGVWRIRELGERNVDRPLGAGQGEFEKRGIDNVLLPTGQRISFARRRDLAKEEGTFDPASQSASAHLVWEISDEAIDCVNAHFDQIAQRVATSGAVGVGESLSDKEALPGLLVVDELGRLEMEHSRGLTSALSLLDQGASMRFPHAVVVAREWLMDAVLERLGSVWCSIEIIRPDETSRESILTAFGVKTSS